MKTIIRNVEAYDVIQIRRAGWQTNPAFTNERVRHLNGFDAEGWQDLMTLRTDAEIAEAKRAVRTGWTKACGEAEYRIKAGNWTGIRADDGIVYSKEIAAQIEADRTAEANERVIWEGQVAATSKVRAALVRFLACDATDYEVRRIAEHVVNNLAVDDTQIDVTYLTEAATVAGL